MWLLYTAPQKVYIINNLSERILPSQRVLLIWKVDCCGNNFLEPKILSFIHSFCYLLTALNEALKQEVERLKMATGDMSNPSDTFNIGMQHLPSFHHPSSLFALAQVQVQQQHQSQHHHHHTQSFSQFHHQSQFHNPNSLPDMMHQESIGRLQGLDISKGPAIVVKSESSSISASESSSTF